MAVKHSMQGILATVTFSNTSAAAAALYKWNACFDNYIHNDVFEIELDGVRISYFGILAKRGEPMADDFVMVAPGKKVSCTVDLAAAYKFLAGKHRCKIRYSALNPYLGRTGFDSLTSNGVVFEYSL